MIPDRPLRITLEDYGQELLSFTLRNRRIEDTNSLGSFWKGRKIMNATIMPGDQIRFSGGGLLDFPVSGVTFADLAA